jgi:hypothetical protein
MLNLSRCEKSIGYTTLWELSLLPSLVIVIVQTFIIGLYLKICNCGSIVCWILQTESNEANSRSCKRIMHHMVAWEFMDIPWVV